jgi:hypothetical protein
MRHRHPEWSVERIVRTVQAISLTEDITWIDADAPEEDGDDENPPADAPQFRGDEEASPVRAVMSNGSPAVTSETLREIPA